MKDCHLKSPPNSLRQKGTGGLFFVLLLYFLLSGCNRPHATAVKFDEIDASPDPLQISVPSQEPILIRLKKAELKMTPLAVYKIAALVVGAESYSFGWNAKISPVDLALAWGKLAEQEFQKYISYSQDNRWVVFNIKKDSPLDVAYVTSHASNHHIIPATQNIRYAVQTIKKKQKVLLEGFLVDITGTYDGKTVWWNTSLSRTDTGSGACEILYVTKARIGNKVYE